MSPLIYFVFVANWSIRINFALDVIAFKARILHEQHIVLGSHAHINDPNDVGVLALRVNQLFSSCEIMTQSRVPQQLLRGCLHYNGLHIHTLQQNKKTYLLFVCAYS
jgi:hypothetical protein